MLDISIGSRARIHDGISAVLLSLNHLESLCLCAPSLSCLCLHGLLYCGSQRRSARLVGVGLECPFDLRPQALCEPCILLVLYEHCSPRSAIRRSLMHGWDRAIFWRNPTPCGNTSNVAF